MHQVITLTMSTDYVRHWGIWEAVRELIQNGIDHDRNAFEFEYADGVLDLYSPLAGLEMKSLLLGQSEKSEGAIGQFGEGYKLAMLVLCRLGKEVIIRNRDMIWQPCLEYNSNFDCTVLNVHIDNLGACDGLRYTITGVSEDEYALITRNWRREPVYTGAGEVLEVADEIGRLYVGGLYVCTLEQFKKYGFDFRPDAIKLNRDRDVPSMFDLQWATSALLAAESKDDELLTMMEESAPEVEYIYAHGPTKVVAAYVNKYPEHVPVSSQEEVAALPEGTKWRIVPYRLMEVLRNAGLAIAKVFKKKSPKERLIELYATLEDRLSEDELIELNAIIAELPN